MDEDGLPTLFLDTRPDFRFQFHLRLFERQRKKNYGIGRRPLELNCAKFPPLLPLHIEFIEIIILDMMAELNYWNLDSSRSSSIISYVSLRESASVDGRCEKVRINGNQKPGRK